MIKCDFCKHSKLNQFGKLKCPYSYCHLSQDTINKMLKTIGTENNYRNRK